MDFEMCLCLPQNMMLAAAVWMKETSIASCFIFSARLLNPDPDHPFGMCTCGGGLVAGCYSTADPPLSAAHGTTSSSIYLKNA